MLSKIKHCIAKVFSRLLKTEESRRVIAYYVAERQKPESVIANLSSPYTTYSTNNENVSEHAPIFVTGRFRSGSTLLWNMFRQRSDTKAFYEPFNERRWFDENFRGDKTDSTHLGVDDYWREYQELSSLSNFYKEEWIYKNLHMSADFCDPKMKSFVDAMISSTKKIPVLQFNRIDFRLPWLKHNYPHAKFLHIYRNPRDQWLSFITNKDVCNKDNIDETYKDGFYLNTWCKDLASTFPFLSNEQTSDWYMKFYYIWKLSYLYGEQYCDLSIKFEDIVLNPQSTIEKMQTELDLAPQSEVMEGVVQTPQLSRWKSWADEDWFYSRELQCEMTLDSFLKATNSKTASNVKC